MPISPKVLDDLFEGSLRPYADRLLAHCLAHQVDPQASTFTLAAVLLAGIDRSVRFATVTPIEHRVERDRLLCDVSLRLAELAL